SSTITRRACCAGAAIPDREASRSDSDGERQPPAAGCPRFEMLFNSAPFLFVFLPVTVAGFFLLARWAGATAALAWATLASLVFYGWDDPSRLVPLISVSIVFNFLIGRRLARRRSRPVLFCGVAGNLLLLSWFKYASL